MTDKSNVQQSPTRRRDGAVAMACVAGVLVMAGMSYAAVPLYRMFCQVTGLGGTTQRADAPSSTILDRTVRVRFDANVAPGLGWTFEPLQRTVDVKVGENFLAFYRATNTSGQVLKGSATYNVSPDSAGPHFAKIECFCFTEQTLQPGESIEMPVSFFVDPGFVKDTESARISEITLSYTFYRVDGAAGGQASAGQPEDKRS